VYASSAVQDLEEDPELRQQVELYKNPVAGPVEAADAANAMEESDGDDQDLRMLEVPLEELLDDLEGLAMDDA
jgi:nonsense-mediated mRNA decay protein 3